MSDVPRDRWSRPLIVPPDGGKAVAYTRVTTVAKTLDDESALKAWTQRMTALGLIDNPALLAKASTVRDDKKKLNDVCEEAAKAAGSNDRATLGTALHSITELVDLGLAPKVLPQLQPDIDAYTTTLAANGVELIPAFIEGFVVLDEQKVAGTFDRLVRLPDGRLVVADLKTGTDLSYSWRSIAVQLAAYSRGLLYIDEKRAPLPADLDRTVGLVIHLPAGEGRCTLHTVDLVAGWEYFERSVEVRAWRARKDIAKPYVALNGWVAVPHIPDPKANEQFVMSDHVVPAIPERTKWLTDKVQALIAQGYGEELGARWPEGCPRISKASDAQLDLIAAEVEAVEAAHALPFTPVDPAPAKKSRGRKKAEIVEDDDRTPTPDDMASLQLAIGQLSEADIAHIGRWVLEAHLAGTPISLKTDPTYAKLRIAWNCHALVKSGADDELTRDLIFAATLNEQVRMPSFTVGQVLASLTTSESRRLNALVRGLAADELTIGFTPDGLPVFGGPAWEGLAAA